MQLQYALHIPNGSCKGAVTAYPKGSQPERNKLDSSWHMHITVEGGRHCGGPAGGAVSAYPGISRMDHDEVSASVQVALDMVGARLMRIPALGAEPADPLVALVGPGHKEWRTWYNLHGYPEEATYSAAARWAAGRPGGFPAIEGGCC